MKDLIEALTIFSKYGNPSNPTHCGYDMLIICGIEVESVCDEDKEKLDKLGFFVSSEFDAFASFKFGSA